MDDKEIMYEILNSESESLTLAQIEGILDDELEKSPEEMDGDLVELCIEALTSAGAEQSNKRRHHFTLAKLLAAAVIFVVMIGISIPACAKFFSVNVPEGIVSIYKDCFNVDISNNGRFDDIIGRLEQDGIEGAVLPKMVLARDTKVFDYKTSYENNHNMFKFKFESNSITGHITLRNYNEDYIFSTEREKESTNFEQVIHIDANGIDIIVFAQNDISYIRYAIKGIEYNIVLNCDFETACEIAETI